MRSISSYGSKALAVLVGTFWICCPAATSEGPSAAAPGESVASGVLVLAPEEEPGERLVLSGTLVGPDGAPLPGTVVRAFQTDAEGYYARGPGGRELGSSRARLSGRFRTGSDGRFRIETVRPAGYPGSRVASHVHFLVDHPGYEDRELTLYFAEDPRLTDHDRRRLESYSQSFVRPSERGSDGVWHCDFELRLPP